MPNLVDLAKDILRHAEELQARLDKAGAPEPTLEAGGPLHYPGKLDQPSLNAVRAQLIDASKDMYQLALGPVDTLGIMIGAERCNVSILRVIVHYDLPTIVSRHGPISFSDLAAEIKVDPETLERILRLGFAVNLFKEEPKNHVSHTALTEAFPVLRDWIALNVRDDFNRAMIRWDDALKVYKEPRPEGQRTLPWNIGNETDKSFFDVFAGDPNDSKLFSAAMTSVSRLLGGSGYNVFVKNYDWSQFGEGPVVDLGGGNGWFSAVIAEAHPKLRLIVQDLPVNEAPFNETVPEELKDRVSYQVQDFFQPQKMQLGAKAFILKTIIHDWPDHESAIILRHLIPEVEKGAKILIMDRLLAGAGHKATHQERVSRFHDCLMFSLLGAKERSKEQWESLLALTDKRLKVLGWNQPEAYEFSIIEVGIIE